MLAEVERASGGGVRSVNVDGRSVRDELVMMVERRDALVLSVDGRVRVMRLSRSSGESA